MNRRSVSSHNNSCQEFTFLQFNLTSPPLVITPTLPNFTIEVSNALKKAFSSLANLFTIIFVGFSRNNAWSEPNTPFPSIKCLKYALSNWLAVESRKAPALRLLLARGHTVRKLCANCGSMVGSTLSVALKS